MGDIIPFSKRKNPGEISIHPENFQEKQRQEKQIVSLNKLMTDFQKRILTLSSDDLALTQEKQWEFYKMREMVTFFETIVDTISLEDFTSAAYLFELFFSTYNLQYDDLAGETPVQRIERAFIGYCNGKDSSFIQEAIDGFEGLSRKESKAGDFYGYCFHHAREIGDQLRAFHKNISSSHLSVIK